MKKLRLTFYYGLLGCAIASAGDFATEMLDATCKLFHVDSTGTGAGQIYSRSGDFLVLRIFLLLWYM